VTAAADSAVPGLHIPGTWCHGGPPAPIDRGEDTAQQPQGDDPAEYHDQQHLEEVSADHRVAHPVGAENPVTSCHVYVLVHEAAEPVSSYGSEDRAGGRGSAACGRVLFERSVWAVGVVVLDELVQHRREGAAPDDQKMI
jgi:hypothetical protein